MSPHPPVPAPPAGFPDADAPTAYRRLLAGIVAGRAPDPPYVRRLGLPRITGWRPGQVVCATAVSDDLCWRDGVALGGWVLCLLDVFAGLAALTVLPDGGRFLTAGVTVDFARSVAPGPVTFEATVVGLSAVRARVEVRLHQHEAVATRGTVTQILSAPAPAALSFPADVD